MAEDVRLHIVVEGMKDLKELNSQFKVMIAAAGRLATEEEKLAAANEKVEQKQKALIKSLGKKITLTRELNAISDKFQKGEITSTQAQEKHTAAIIASKTGHVQLNSALQSAIKMLAELQVQHKKNTTEINRDVTARQKLVTTMAQEKEALRLEQRLLKQVLNGTKSLSDVKKKLIAQSYESQGATKKEANAIAKYKTNVVDLKKAIADKENAEKKAAADAQRIAKQREQARQKEIQDYAKLRQSFKTRIQGLRHESAEMQKVLAGTKTLTAAKGSLLENSLKLKGATAAEAKEITRLRQEIDKTTKAIAKQNAVERRGGGGRGGGRGRRGGTLPGAKGLGMAGMGVGLAASSALLLRMGKGMAAVLAGGAGVAVVIRGMARAMRSVVAATIDMAKELERGRIRLGAILANTEMLGKTFKNVEEAGKGYAAQLARADVLQRKILIKSTEVVGTSRELIEMHSRVVALSGQQVASDNDRIDFASTLLTITRAMGLQGEKALTEARQLFELNRLQGQTVLQTLQINIKDAREWKRKGILLEEYNKRFLVFLAAQQDMALTWENLNESLRVFSRLMLVSFAAEQFEQGKNFLTGFRDALRVNEASLKKQADYARDLKASMKETAKIGAPWWLQRERRDEVKITQKKGRTMIGGVPAAPGTSLEQQKAAAESMKRTLDDDLAGSIEKIGRAMGDLFTKALDFVSVLTGTALDEFSDPDAGWEGRIKAMTAALQNAIEFVKDWNKWWNQSAGLIQTFGKTVSFLVSTAANFVTMTAKAMFALGKTLFVGLWEQLDPVAWAASKLQDTLQVLKKKLPTVFAALDIGNALSKFIKTEIEVNTKLDINNPKEHLKFVDMWKEGMEKATGIIDEGKIENVEKMAEGLKAIGVAAGLTNPILEKTNEVTDEQVTALEAWRKAQEKIDLDKKRGGGGIGEPSAAELKKLKAADRYWEKELARLDLQHAKLKMSAKALREFRTEQKVAEALARAGLKWETMSAAQRKKWEDRRKDMQGKELRNLKAINAEKMRQNKEVDAEALLLLMKQNEAKMLVRAQDMDHLDAQEQQLELAVKLLEVELKSQMVEYEGGVKKRRYDDATIKRMTNQLRLTTKIDKEWEDHIASVEEGTLDMVQIFDQAFESIENGAKGLSDVFENVGKDMVKRFAKQFLFGKKQEFDLPFKMNLQGLVGPSGIIGQLMGEGGQQGATSFVGGFFNKVAGLLGAGGGAAGQLHTTAPGGTGGTGGVGSWGGIGNFFAGAAGNRPQSHFDNLPYGEADFNEAIRTGRPAPGGGGVKQHVSPGMGGGLVSGIAHVAGYKGKGGHIGAMIGTVLAAANIGAQVFGAFANIVVPGIGFLIGFAMEELLGALLKPGRIKQDKREIRGFAKEIGLSGVDPQGSKSLTVRHQQADVEFAGQQGGLAALSLMYVDLNDKIEHVFGTMKRFTNQFQVGFLEAGLTMEEANQKVLELAEKMGFTIQTVVKQINKFATETNLAEFREELEETGRSGNEMLFLSEMLKGGIEIATKFNPLIDATALSNRYLADAFREAGETAGLLDEDLAGLEDRIRSGDLNVEDAIGELHDIGITSLRIQNIKLDADQIREELERAMEQSQMAMKGLGIAIAKGLEAGLKGGDVAAAAEAGFREVFRAALQAKAMETFIEENLASWFHDFDFTKPIDMSSDAFQDLASEIGIAAEQLYALLEAANLLPDTIGAASAEMNVLNNALVAIKQQIIDVQLAFAANLVAIGAGSALDLQQQKHGRTSTQLGIHSSLNLHEGGVWDLEQSSEAGLRAWAQAFANMRQAEVDLFQARAAAEQRRLQDEIDGINDQREADLEANTELVKAANDRLTLAREERAEIAQLAQEAKALAQNFEQSADKIGDMIRTIATGSSAFTTGEQLGVLQLQEASLRTALAGAGAEDQPELFDQLAANLVAQLKMSRNQGSALTDETNTTLQELEDLQTQALAAAVAQRNIERDMNNTLTSIDNRIEADTDLITSLQEEANRINKDAKKAIEAAQDRSTLAVDQMRRETVAKLHALHIREMQVWEGIQILTAARFTEEQRMDANLQLTLNRLDATIGALNTYLTGLTDNGNNGNNGASDIHSASGFSGMVSRPTWFQVAERGPEHVQVTPVGESVPGPLHLTIAPTINVSGAANGKAVGQQVYRQIEDGIIRSMESGRLRGVLKKGH